MTSNDPSEIARFPDRTVHKSNPPFDDSEPCICCPDNVRDLLATVHNFIGAFERDEHGRIPKKFHSMKQSYERLQRACDAHFADRMHSHGQVNR